ncbi:exosortase A [Pseudoduganella sp. RAF53_2]|uniref:exosortase A n=1 Tax=unclassified Pseudoduganella TaxID=2637179 RepID=UPI003F989F11
MNILQTERPAAVAQDAAASPGTQGKAAAPNGMRNALLVAAVMLLPILIYWSTAASIVAIWERSGTFAHGYVILPISLWLIWRQRDVLETLPVKPFWPGLILVAGCGVAWLLADLVEVQIVKQYAFAAMMPLTVLTLLGTRIARAAAFPLLFILFGVPVGESLIPPLIEVTANFTIDALRMTGIPVLREGNSFSIPSGNWSVVEACSGLRYLISSITLGFLYAHLTYRSRWRQGLFVLAACVVPVLANGMRAYMIVMIGHLSGMKLAVGVDHLIYGWVFFGLVMLLLFWIGSFWREDREEPARASAAPAPVAMAAVPVPRIAAAALALLAAAGVWPAYAHYVEDNGAAPAVQLVQFHPAAPAAEAFTSWEPDYPQASGQLRSFHATSSSPVGIEVRYYRDQVDGAKLISSSNRLGWDHDGLHESSSARRTETIAGQTVEVSETVLSGGVGGRRMLVWHWYWIGGKMTSSNYVGKLLQMKQKLLAGSGDGAVVMVFSQYDEKPDNARAAMREFLNSNLTPLDAALASNKRH